MCLARCSSIVTLGYTVIVKIEMNAEETKQAMLALIKDNPTVKWDSRDVNLSSDLSKAETASEVAALLADRFGRLEKRFGEAFLSLVKESFSPEVWEPLGVFVNPKTIPDRGLDHYYVLADGSVKTVQDEAASATYYGDVDLTVKWGIAFVQDTKNRVLIDGNGSVIAQGNTQVYATGHGLVDLQDHARAIVQDDVTVQTFDHSFVESIGGRPDITAYGQSRFLISEGSAKIQMYEFSRGMLLSADRLLKPIKVLTGGEGVLYVGPGNPNNVRITKKSDDCIILDGNVQHIAPEEIRGLILPEYGERNLRIGDPIMNPLDGEQLKADLVPYLPTWHDQVDRDLYEWATNEKSICAAIQAYIPEMVQKGLTGDFLRTHFTEQTLNANRIITRADNADELSLLLHEALRDPCYFFGDLLVNDRFCTGPVYGFEHTLVLAGGGAVINGSANAIVTGEGSLKAYGTGKVFALDDASVEAFDRVQLYLEGTSRGVTTGQVYVRAHDESHLLGHGHMQAELYDHCTMVANEHSRVLTLGDNQVSVMGQAEVAFPTFDIGHKANIELKSNEATLIGLDNPDRVERYRGAMANEQSRELTRSTGWGR